VTAIAVHVTGCVGYPDGLTSRGSTSGCPSQGVEGDEAGQALRRRPNDHKLGRALSSHRSARLERGAPAKARNFGKAPDQGPSARDGSAVGAPNLRAARPGVFAAAQVLAAEASRAAPRAAAAVGAPAAGRGQPLAIWKRMSTLDPLRDQARPPPASPTARGRMQKDTGGWVGGGLSRTRRSESGLKTHCNRCRGIFSLGLHFVNPMQDGCYVVCWWPEKRQD